jgi:hypothetical protein
MSCLFVLFVLLVLDNCPFGHVDILDIGDGLFDLVDCLSDVLNALLLLLFIKLHYKFKRKFI